jgi:tocopherol O-methyltransferase
MRSDQIIYYYDSCETDYRLFWDLAYSQAMHAGYWDENTKTLRDALHRENEILAERAQIKPGEQVLDAGCGIGGSSLYLAQTHQCQVTGITLSAKQVETATKLA